MERLRQLVQRLARPIDFASRNSFAHLSTVKNLGPFISAQVIQALSEQVYRPEVEIELLTLHQLFADFDQCLETKEQQVRLATARQILDRLKMMGDGQSGSLQGKRPSRPGSVPSLCPVELWNIPIQYAKGVGPKRAALLERLGVRTVEDALWFLPWRYEDRSQVVAINQLAPGMQATVCGTVRSRALKQTARRRMAVLDVTVEDGTGVLHAVFFNQPYLETLLKPGTRVMLSGLVRGGRGGWADLRMDVPQYEVLGDDDEAPLHVGRIVPIYHETKGLSSRQLRVLIKGLLDHYVGGLEEILPASVRFKHRLPGIQTAIAEAHFPPPSANREALERRSTPAHRRLAFEEFFLLELALAMRQRAVKEEVKGIRFDPNTPLLARLRELLPFQLTPAQERVLSEIQRDMASPRPMNRLLQGDVGCGKTIIALASIVLACGSGYQAALMVPTEILAEQHYLNLRGLLASLGLKAVLLKSGGRSKDRSLVLAQIKSGEAQVVIGTHAIIQKDVRFARLGLAVIDEQHKFGVLQRKTLLDKGYHPDVLVLTATPIPRTLAMTIYGDLDVSVIDALPPGRRPVRTLLFSEAQRGRAYQLVLEEIKAGHQAYIVYPLVDESEKVDLQAAIQAAERLQAEEFKDWRVGLLHGRMKAEEKEQTMAAFKAQEIQILVATIVIEVGVDVPNASVMLVEHAERFGLAQLHQLRGRVGRGPYQSYCLLISSAGSGVEKPTAIASPSAARRRLEALIRSSDGFAIAEEDLRIRGPGDFFGVRQWGIPEFRAASLIRDVQTLTQARQEAFALLASDPHLSRHQALREAMLRRWKSKLDLGTVS